MCSFRTGTGHVFDIGLVSGIRLESDAQASDRRSESVRFRTYPASPSRIAGERVGTSRPDRRIERTRRRLKGALAELLAERDYDQITVQNIVDRADVGRSTFYAHYESKEDLLFAGLDRHLMLLVERPPPGVSPERDASRFRFSLPLLLHARDQRRFFEATILGGSDSRIRDVSAGIIADLALAELDRLGSGEIEARAREQGCHPAELRLASARAVVGAFMGVLDWWLRSADHLSVDVVDDVFQRAATGVLRADSKLDLPDARR